MLEWFKNNFSWPKFIMIFVVIWLLSFFLFKDQIMKTKIAQTKMNALQGIMKADNPEEAIENVREAIDTTLNSNKEE